MNVARRALSGKPRMSTAYESPSPTQAEPSTVAPIATVAGARVSETPFRSRAKSSVVMKPPSIQTSPPSCGAEERERGARVAGERERAQ